MPTPAEIKAAAAAQKAKNAAAAPEAPAAAEKALRRPAHEILARHEEHYADLIKKNRAKEERLAEKIKALKEGKKITVTAAEAASVVASGKTPEQMIAEARKLMAMAKVAKKLTPEELSAAVVPVEDEPVAEAEDEPVAEAEDEPVAEAEGSEDELAAPPEL